MSKAGDILGVGKKALDLADALRSFDFVVPEDAAIDKNGNARFLVPVTIADAYRKASVGQAKQQRTDLIIKVKGRAEAGNNKGKVRMFHILVNFGWVNGESSSLGDGNGDNETTMNSMSLTKLRTLFGALALPLDDDGGLDPTTLGEAFPLREDESAAIEPSILSGETVTLQMVEGKRKDKRDNTFKVQQDLEAFIPEA